MASMDLQRDRWLCKLDKQCAYAVASQHAFRPLQELAVKWSTASTER